jgi:hypothetical protein
MLAARLSGNSRYDNLVTFRWLIGQRSFPFLALRWDRGGPLVGVTN